MTNGAADVAEASKGNPPLGIALSDGLGVIGPRRYMTILADPPWAQTMSNGYKRRNKQEERLPYGAMTLDDIKALPVGAWADEARTCGCGQRTNTCGPALT